MTNQEQLMLDNSVIDLTRITDARAALICARLHLRRGKRYLQKGLTTEGIAALYDSVLFGMHYYITKHNASSHQKINPWDAAGMVHALTRMGLFENSVTFNRFSLVVERALWQGPFSSDVYLILADVENLLMKLGVLPFTRNILMK